MQAAVVPRDSSAAGHEQGLPGPRVQERWPRHSVAAVARGTRTNTAIMDMDMDMDTAIMDMDKRHAKGH